MDAEGITLTENAQSSVDENDPARDGGFALQFSLNEERPSLEKEIALSVPAKITAPFTFEIREEDITLAAALVMISLAGGVTMILMRRNRKKTK